MIKIAENDLYQLLIAEVRYALKRDNHLAPGTCVQHIMNYLPNMLTEWKVHTAEQIAVEVIQELAWNDKGGLTYEAEWEKLLKFLLDYLEKRPPNADRYMRYLFNKPGHVCEIDWNSKELNDKFVENYRKGTV
jgi:hypothetical protein